MKYFFIIVLLLLVVGVFFYWFVQDQNKRIVITHYPLHTSVQSDFRIVHLSDLHSTCFKGLVEIVKDQHPDMIAITGDLINDKGKHVPEMLAYVQAFSSVCPVFYVTGNHERRLINFEEIMLQVEQAGAQVLRNNICHTKIRDESISILGLDENQGSFSGYKEQLKGTFHYQDNSAFFGQLEKSKGFRLVLTHFPENFACIGKHSYHLFDYDLMLAGHAHGGQFNLPWIGPVFSPGQGLFPKYAKGSFGQRPKLIVSRGMGNSEFPLRLFNHPEIVIIDVQTNRSSS